MISIKELIERHSNQHSDFRYYVPIIEKAERNEIEHPDIAIECCNSLIQGISKTLILRLDQTANRNALDNLSTHQLVKAALRCLKEHDDIIEDDFVRKGESLTLAIATLRNARGDISHGRAIPKDLQSDRSLSRLVLNMSEALLRYMLATYFALKTSAVELVAYEENPKFNDHLDGLYPLEGKPLYSLALYQQYREDYIIRLEEFNYERETSEE